MAFAVPASLLLYYGFRGGSYDIVPRQQEALAIWWVLGLAFAFGLLPRAKPPKGVLVPLGAIALLAIWTAISLSWTQSDERTFAELARLMHYGGLLLLIWSVIDVRTWRPAAAGLLVGAVAICAIALASRLVPSIFPTDYVVRDFEINRLSYPFNYWNAVGAFSVMSMGMALMWSAHAQRPWTRMAALACVPVVASCAYLTYSRAAVIGTALGVVLVIVLSRNRWVALVHVLGAAAGSAIAIDVIRNHPEIADAKGNAGAFVVILALIGAALICAATAAATWYLRGDQRWRLPKRPARIATLVGVLLVVILVPTAGHAEINKGWHSFKKLPPSETSSDPAARLKNLNGNRYFIWRSSLKAFDRHPVKGVGAGTFDFWWFKTGGGEFLRDAHSIYLEELAEQGIFGGLLTLTLLIGLAVAGVRARFRVRPEDVGIQGALLVAFGVFLFHAGVDWMWESTTVAVLALGAVAVAAAAASKPAERRSRAPLRAAVVAVAVIAILIELPGLVSVSKTRESQSNFNKGNNQAALAQATDAIDAEPWAASPYVQRALVEESMNRLGAARTDLVRAEQREPYNFRHPLVLSRVDAELGDVATALKDFRRAKALRPRSPLVTPQP